MKLNQKKKKSLPKNNSLGLNGFTKFCQNFKELKLIILKLFQRNKMEETPKAILQDQHCPDI